MLIIQETALGPIIVDGAVLSIINDDIYPTMMIVAVATVNGPTVTVTPFVTLQVQGMANLFLALFANPVPLKQVLPPNNDIWEQVYNQSSKIFESLDASSLPYL